MRSAAPRCQEQADAQPAQFEQRLPTINHAEVRKKYNEWLAKRGFAQEKYFEFDNFATRKRGRKKQQQPTEQHRDETDNP